MDKILFHTLSHGEGKIFDASERDNCNEPQILLRKELQKRCIDYDTSDNHSLDNCRWIIFSEIISTYQGAKGKLRKLKRKIKGYSTRDVFKECLNRGLQDKMVLVLTEPLSVFPENWSIKWHSVFPIIFTWNDKLIDDKKYFKIPAVPQPENYLNNTKKKCFSQKKLLVNISTNKTSSSSNELYSERQNTIYFFESKHPENFDLYGIGWNKPQNIIQSCFPQKVKYHSSYRGPINHKWEVLPNYKFSICYENIFGELGYITEKIFDSMRCSCVPIYWGAENVSEYVDSKAFIERRDFSSNFELENYITSMNENEYYEYLDNIELYLRSDQFKSFLASSWIDTLLDKLGIS